MSKELADGLTVLVSGDGTMKFLPVLKLPNATRRSAAIAVVNLIHQWNLIDVYVF